MAMKNYTVTSAKWRYQSGLIGLTAAQAHARRHLLQPQKPKGVYELAQPCDFRKGEVIQLEESRVTPSDLRDLTLTDEAERAEVVKETARTTIKDILREYPDIAQELMERGRDEEQKLSAAKLEAVRKEAYDEGYGRGRADEKAGVVLGKDEAPGQPDGDQAGETTGKPEAISTGESADLSQFIAGGGKKRQGGK